MSYTRVKTRFIAETSIERFLLTQRNVYLWTFTEPGNDAGNVIRKLWTKTEAEEHVKPFLDLLRRRGAEFLLVWELQKRGSWHPHILINCRLDVSTVRPWMMARGWGQQMHVDWVVRGGVMHDKYGHPCSSQQLVDYLTKKLRSYLLKARTDDAVEPRKKFFGGTHRSKVGTIKFAWNPWTDTAHSILYYWGRRLYVEMLGYVPSQKKLFHNMPSIMQLGCRDLDWLDVDFLYEPPFSSA